MCACQTLPFPVFNAEHSNGDDGSHDKEGTHSNDDDGDVITHRFAVVDERNVVRDWKIAVETKNNTKANMKQWKHFHGKGRQ